MKNNAPLHIRLGRGAVLVTLCFFFMGGVALAQVCNNGGRGCCPVRHPQHRCGAQRTYQPTRTQTQNLGGWRCPHRQFLHHRCGPQCVVQSRYRPTTNHRGERIRWVGIPSPSNPQGALPNYRYETSTQGQYRGSPQIRVEVPYEYPIYPNIYNRYYNGY